MGRYRHPTRLAARLVGRETIGRDIAVLAIAQLFGATMVAVLAGILVLSLRSDSTSPRW